MLLLAIFTLQNTHTARIHVLGWTFTASVALLILGVAVVGIAVGWLLRSARGPEGFSLFGYTRVRG